MKTRTTGDRRSRLLSTAAALGLILFGAPANAQQKPILAQPTPDPLERLNESIDALTKKVWPSVVQIQVTSYGAQQDNTRNDANVVIGQQRSVGSGFVIDGDGYIMTNAHVVNNAQRIEVMLAPANADGRLATALSNKATTLAARLIGISSELDLALIKVEGMKLPALPLATYSNLRQGETVFAFGSPGGLRQTLTHGMVSAVARQVDIDSPLIYVQTDAPINPGNSGGPLVNTRGEVVGMNTFIVSQSGGSEGLGFAIPSATVRTAFRQFQKYGQLRRQETGMTIQTITPAMAGALGLSRDYGLIVSDVWPGGPAEKGGLKVGDILLSVDGQPADNLPTVNYYFRLRDSTENVKVMVQRGAMQHPLSLATVEERNEFDAVSSMVDTQKNLVPELGILGVEIDQKIAAAARGLRDPYGIIVVARVAGATSVVPLLARDVVRSVNNAQVTTLQALRDAVRVLKPGSPVALQIQRDGRLMYVTYTVE